MATRSSNFPDSLVGLRPCRFQEREQSLLERPRILVRRDASSPCEVHRVHHLPIHVELTLFDTSTGTAVALNRTAADILALADGATTVSDVVATLARSYAVEPSQIADEVLAVVRELTAAGILLPEA